MPSLSLATASLSFFSYLSLHDLSVCYPCLCPYPCHCPDLCPSWRIYLPRLHNPPSFHWISRCESCSNPPSPCLSWRFHFLSPHYRFWISFCYHDLYPLYLYHLYPYLYALFFCHLCLCLCLCPCLCAHAPDPCSVIHF